MGEDGSTPGAVTTPSAKRRTGRNAAAEGEGRTHPHPKPAPSRGSHRSPSKQRSGAAADDAATTDLSSGSGRSQPKTNGSASKQGGARGRKTDRVSVAEEAAAPLSAGGHCFICTEEIDCRAIGDCSHETCHRCNLKLRALYKNTQCPLCKVENKVVVYSAASTHEKPGWSSFLPLSNDTYRFDKKLRIYFDGADVEAMVIAMLRFACPAEQCSFVSLSGWGELKKHAKQTHQLQFCDICTKHKKVFSREQHLYSKSGLERHTTQGDPDDPSFKGHPMCEFCQQHFYSGDELYEHCRKEHETCFLCVRQRIQHLYFENYRSLDQHFRAEHFACLDPACIEDRFVVFQTSVELKEHQLKAHAHKYGKGKQSRTLDVQLSFRDREDLPTGPRASRAPASSSSLQHSQPEVTNGNDRRGRGKTAKRNAQAASSSMTAAGPPEEHRPPAALSGGGGRVIRAPARFGGRLTIPDDRPEDEETAGETGHGSAARKNKKGAVSAASAAGNTTSAMLHRLEAEEGRRQPSAAAAAAAAAATTADLDGLHRHTTTLFPMASSLLLPASSARGKDELLLQRIRAAVSGLANADETYSILRLSASQLAHGNIDSTLFLERWMMFVPSPWSMRLWSQVVDAMPDETKRNALQTAMQDAKIKRAQTNGDDGPYIPRGRGWESSSSSSGAGPPKKSNVMRITGGFAGGSDLAQRFDPSKPIWGNTEAPSGSGNSGHDNTSEEKDGGRSTSMDNNGSASGSGKISQRQKKRLIALQQLEEQQAREQAARQASQFSWKEKPAFPGSRSTSTTGHGNGAATSVSPHRSHSRHSPRMNNGEGPSNDHGEFDDHHEDEDEGSGDFAALDAIVKGMARTSLSTQDARSLDQIGGVDSTIFPRLDDVEEQQHDNADDFPPVRNSSPAAVHQRHQPAYRGNGRGAAAASAPRPWGSQAAAASRRAEDFPVLGWDRPAASASASSASTLAAATSATQGKKKAKKGKNILLQFG